MQKSAVCPECDGEVQFVKPAAIDQRVLCPSCASALIVIRTNPTILDWAFAEPLSPPDRSEFMDMHSLQAWEDR
jgi:hypothetical protein